jgi:ATP-dependent Clp protease adaptor protein ClpS
MANTQATGVAEITKLKSPPKYCVVLLNDDSTPMEFVINVCQTIFNKTKTKAEAITAEVHKTGKGIAGTYSYEVAEQKCVETVTEARRNGFPLDVTLEKTE